MSVWVDIVDGMVVDAKSSKALTGNSRRKPVSLLIKNLQPFRELVEEN